MGVRSVAVSRSSVVMLAPGAKVGKAKVSLQKTLGSPQQDSQKEAQAAKPKQKRVTEEEPVPMYKVFLLGDEGYPREHVILCCQEILPDTDNTRATELFDMAQKTGQALCGIYPQECAELYVEQFTRADPIIYSELKEDKFQ